MSLFVLDASAAIAWASPDEQPPAAVARAVAKGGSVAPAIWLFEVQNTLAMLKRRGRLIGEDWAAAADALRAVPIEIEPADRERAENEIPGLAEQCGLTVYDAAYLELARRRRIPLATLDEGLRKAARKARVKLI
ncbi:type II toxin-antitoxin system VapC family toxin [Fontimonas sp. SYSU GA230001]|uniref:type II toxin-antitoxin system VapC family toxin n=1 Tax=Fontimonas sp. SYSU GA230001 TaxID=3142450 RepID=UPI0032B33357